MLIFVVFEKSHRFFSPSKFDPFFTIFLQITSKYAQKHHIKKQSEKFIHWKKILITKTVKMAKKGAKVVVFFGPGGPNFDPFSTIFYKSLLNMPKNIILKK